MCVAGRLRRAYLQEISRVSRQLVAGPLRSGGRKHPIPSSEGLDLAGGGGGGWAASSTARESKRWVAVVVAGPTTESKRTSEFLAHDDRKYRERLWIAASLICIVRSRHS